MKRFTSVFARMPKKLLVTGAIVGAVISGTVMLTGRSQANWGPTRPTYTAANPAPHVTFNSITDNQSFGDERTFYDARNASNPNGPAQDQIQVADGDELVMRVYVHNNAAANLNGANLDGAGVSDNTRVQITLPTSTDNALRSTA